MAKRLYSYADSVFEEVTALARGCGAINLGSGTPDMSVPEPIQAAAKETIATGHNQCARVRGEMELRSAVAAHEARFYGQEIDPATEITTTNGVTEAMYAALHSVIDPGDEVNIFEPYYDCHVSGIQMAGGTNVCVAPMPMDTFYLNQNYGEQSARFTFCLRKETLAAVAQRLSKLARTDEGGWCEDQGAAASARSLILDPRSSAFVARKAGEVSAC
jgi:N-succinyldiaminopimelate aminotransferase